jgi:glyoxylase-like metal-dependent hydrolase (beta-lactamase superfamily II)
VTHRGFRVGSLEVTTLCQGWAPLDLADELPGRQVDWGAERRRYPWAFVGDEAWRWHVHAFAILGGPETVLIDAGLGSFAPYRSWADTVAPDRMLADAEIDPVTVGHVILTHLHTDHAGGAMLEGEPRFPNAVYHVHQADWAHFEGLDDEDEYVARHAMQRVADLGVLDLEPSDRELTPGVRVVHTPGHTPGHRSVVVADRGDTLVLTGDLLHLPAQVMHPEWPSSHDIDPDLGCHSRQEILARARKGRWAVGVSHFAEPFGTVGADGWS